MMKKLCYFLLFLLVSLKSFSQETEKLPKIPWEDIVEMNSHKYSPIHKWNSDVKVKLEGNYTATDSLNIAKILTKLNAITETIKIGFSKNETSNFKIAFLDTIVHDGNINNKVSSRFSHDPKGFTEGELYIYNSDKCYPNFNGFIESTIAKALVGGFFSYPVHQKRNSIFNPLADYNNNNNIPLNTGDISIINEVYKPDFEKKLKIAEKQFKYILDDIRNQKIKERDGTIWWVKNPEAVLALPMLLLLLMFVFLLKKIDKVLGSKINNNRVKFIIVATIGLLFVDILIGLWNHFHNFLAFPARFHPKGSFIANVFNQFLDASPIIFLLPLVVFLQFLENKIKNSSQKVFTKTALIFLSTGVLPFIMIMGIMHFSGELKYDQDYLQLSRYFLYTMAIASIRALISFFIFKERNLIIENEMKLSSLRELKTKAELKSLQSQINPHFLYNALNSIASLAHTSADKTEKMALSLSDLFKYTINRQGKTISTVNDELDMVRSYLEIEQTRFGERLEFVINAENDVLNEEIPMFILQPLVENAVKHGISKIEDKGLIKLNILKTDKGLNIEVIDNGPNFPEGLVSGHGLQTVYDLLRLSYGDKAAIKWQNIPHKSISISIDKTA